MGTQLGRRNREKDARNIRPLIYAAPVPNTAIFGGTPGTIEPDDAAAQGTSTYAARVDHQHAIATAAAVTLAYSSTNQEGSGSDFARATHTHQITNSSNPGAAASILATNSSGYLQLVRLGVGTSPNFYLDVRGSTTPQALIGYDVSNYSIFSVSSGGDLTIQSNPGDLILYPIGNDVRPDANYDVNLGMMTYKWKEIHAAELWVNTLVAHETIATIGGRILVGATTEFTADLGSGTTHTDSVLNGGFETAGGGGADVFANWTESAGDGAISQVGSNPHSGTYNARLDTGATANTHIYQTWTVTPGDYMSLSFWSRSYTGNTSVGRWWLYDVSNTSDIRSLGAVANATAGDNTWVFTQYGFQVPAGCSSVRLYLYCGTTNTDDNHFDDVILYDAVTITVKHNEMAAGDVAYAEAAPSGTPQFEFFKVLSAASGSSGAYTYEVERNYDSHSGSGTYNDWYKGDALFNTGTDDEGFMDIYSYNSITQSGSTTGPTIAGFVRNTEYYNDWTARWVVGNLDGFFGEGSSTYGVAIGDHDGGNFLKYTSDDNTFAIYAGDENVAIDGTGIHILTTTFAGLSSLNKITWERSDTTVVGEITTADDSGTTNIIRTYAPKISGQDAYARVQAGGNHLTVYDIDGSNAAYVEVADIPFLVNGAGAPGPEPWIAVGYTWAAIQAATTPSSGRLYTSSNIYAGAGIIAGSVANTPSAGQIWSYGDGSSYGLYAGTGKDVQWYRGGADLWSTPDNVQATGYIYSQNYVQSANYFFASGSSAVGLYIRHDSGKIHFGTGDDINLYRGGSNLLKTDDTLNVVGDLYTTAWTDYSSTSTVTGWSSFTYKYIYYKVIGKFVFVNFEIDGTSNSATTTFTLPHAEGHASVVEFVFNGYSTSGWSMRPGTMNSTTVNLYSTWYSHSWPTSGNKVVRGQFCYEMA